MHRHDSTVAPEELWDRTRLSKYDWNLRKWIVVQITGFLEHTPPYDEDVLRYKTARFLLRDVRPGQRHNREALATFYRWVTTLVERVGHDNDEGSPWHQHVYGCYEDIDSERFELEEYGEPNSQDELCL